MTISANFPSVPPSLLMDFANGSQIPPQLTFNRSTSAVYYDDSTTALAEQNLLVYSQDFSNANWTQEAVTITGSQTAPDGTSTAQLFTDTVATSDHRCYAFPSQISAPFYTGSVYLKNGTRRYGMLRLQNGGTTAGAVFDLQTGAVASTGGTGYYSSSITSVGSGWYRCTVTSNAFSSGVGNFVVAMSNTATYSDNIIYTGTGATMYAWGAQLEQRSSATSYTANLVGSTTTNYIPVLLTAGGGQPRFDHNPTTRDPLGLAVEPQRTNSCLYSQDFTTTWSAANQVSITSNTVVAPDGTLTADKLIADATSNVHYVVQNTGNFSAPWTFSCYAKAGEYSRVGFSYSNTGYVFFNLSTGVQEGTVGGGITSTSIVSVGNGWYRLSFTSTSVSSGANIGIYLFNSTYTSGIPTFTGNGFSGLYIWGAQAESGAFPTSYIVTTNAAVTRACETIYMNPADTAAILNIPQGIMLLEISLPSTGYDIGNFACGIGASSTNYLGMFYAGTGYFQPTHGGFGPAGLPNDVAGAVNKAAMMWDGTSGTVPAAYAQNGFSSTTQTGTGMPTCFANYPDITYLSIGYAAFDTAAANRKTAWIRKVAVYPESATTAQLVALTS